MSQALLVVVVAGAAALASVGGGLLALWHRPTSLLMSVALGFAGGVLLATVTLEMIPTALELGGPAAVAGGFGVGLGLIYGFDLFVHRGRIAGERSERYEEVRRFYRQRVPRGDEVTVFAGGTSIEELVEGLAIGVGAAIEPGLALLIGAAIIVDNLAEGLGVGELVRREPAADPRRHLRRTLRWTGLIGAALLVSALAGWFLLRGVAPTGLAFLFAFAGAGLLYLTVTQLVPEAEERQYQQSAALATAAGFVAILLLSALA